MAAIDGAILIDRDGTIIEDPGYLGDSAKLRLLPKVAKAKKRRNREQGEMTRKALIKEARIAMRLYYIILI